MKPQVSLNPTTITVDPGSRAKVSVRVHNPNSIVERYSVEVVGDAAEWALVVPAEVSVFPGDGADVEVAFDPPPSFQTPAGTVPFGVRVRSSVDAANSTVVEGDVEVGGFRNVTANLVPQASHGRRGGKHRLELSNWGNDRISLALAASDPDDRLRFKMSPPVVELPVGGTATPRVKVKPDRTFFRGQPVRHPFTVTVTDEKPAPVGGEPWKREFAGTFEQRQMIPGQLMVLAGLAAVVMAAIVFLMTRSGGVATSATEGSNDSPPAVPTAVTAEAVGTNAVQVSWAPADGVETYTLASIDPATKDSPTPTVDGVTEVPGEQNTMVVEDLEPGIEYCFRVIATSAGGESDPSPIACAITQPSTTTPGPEGVTAEYADDEQTRTELTWTDTSGGTAEHVVLRDGIEVATVRAGLTSATVSLESGENCFSIFSRVGEQESTLSDEVCIEGPGGDDDGDGTSTTVAGGGGGDLGFIAIVHSVPVDQVGSRALAEQRRDQLIAEGHPADILNSLDYPDLFDGVDSGGFWHVYIGGFASRGEAQDFCDTAFGGVNCRPEEPGEEEG